MAFMVPVVKSDYEIYSKSPPKNKPIIPSNNGRNAVKRRPQSNSISIAVLQHKQVQQKQSPRVHSKSLTETNPQNRHRSKSNSTSSNSSIESLEIIRKMMHFMSFDSNNNNENESQKQSKASNHSKSHWTAKIFKKRKNSISSHKIS